MGTEHRDSEFATTWREYDLDHKTRALLDYAEKLTVEPSAIVDEDVDALAAASWDDAGIREPRASSRSTTTPAGSRQPRACRKTSPTPEASTGSFAAKVLTRGAAPR